MTIIIGGGYIGEEFQNQIDDSYIISHANINTMINYFKYIIKKYGKPNLIIITSGFLRKRKVGKFYIYDIDNTIDANYTVPVKFINLAKEMNLQSQIIVFSRSVTYDKREGYSIYSSSKLALEKFIKIYMIEEPEAKIKIIRPSRTDTKLRWDNYEQTEENEKNLLYPEEVVSAVLDFLPKKDIILEIRKDGEKIKCQTKNQLIMSI